MKLLFIDACVRKQSRTRKLCEYYIRKVMDEKDAVLQKVSLAEEKLQPFDEQMLNKRQDDILQDNLNQDIYNYAKNFAHADIIIIGAPYWDCSFPSILKIYFEHICVNKITFSYAADGRPVPLCQAKKLVYVTSSGGYIGNKDTGERYIKDLCEMYGIIDMEIIRAEGLDINGNDVDSILQKCKNNMTLPLM